MVVVVLCIFSSMIILKSGNGEVVLMDKDSEHIAKGPFEAEVRRYCSQFSGIGNFHIHGDRAYTREDQFYAHKGRSVAEIGRGSLAEKQQLTWALHSGLAFEPECIERRMKRMLDESIKYGVKKIFTTVDVTHNTKFVSLEITEKLKREYADRIDVQIGAYNPSGFKKRGVDDERFEIFEEAARRSDFIVALAEKDRDSPHMGERQHNWYMLNLAYKLNKPIHCHVGQGNVPSDNTTELLLDDLAIVQDLHLRVSPSEFPEVVLVHVISPSCKSSEELDSVIDRMVERNVSLLCCPRAAISMLQDSSETTPIHNSIAKVWDFAERGVRIKGLGVDNLNDIYIPASSADVYDEAEYLANSLRFYNAKIIAKVLCGEELDEFDRGTIREELFHKNT